MKFLILLLFFLAISPEQSRSQVLQIKPLHTGPNCGGGVILANGDPVAHFIHADGAKFDRLPSFMRMRISNFYSAGIPQDGGSEFFDVIETIPDSALVGVRFLTLNQYGLGIGFAPPNLTKRHELSDVIVLGSYVEYRNCEVYSYYGSAGHNKSVNGPIQWANSSEMLKRGLGVSGGSDSTFFVAVDHIGGSGQFTGSGGEIEVFSRDQIYNSERVRNNFDFARDDGFEHCYSSVERAALTGRPMRFSSIEQCRTHLLSGFSDVSGLYAERVRDLEYMYAYSVESVGSVLGIPFGRVLRAELHYPSATMVLSHRIKDTENWTTIGEVTSVDISR